MQAQKEPTKQDREVPKMVHLIREWPKSYCGATLRVRHPVHHPGPVDCVVCEDLWWLEHGR